MNLIFNFMWYNFSSIDTPIFFIKKKDDILYLIINYKKLNFIIIKDYYLLSLIPDILNCLVEAKIFIKFNLITTYNKIRIK